MIKIFDCSNGILRPKTRGFKGPVENDVVRYLKKYAHNYGCVFVDEKEKADILFTNDVFTNAELNSTQAKIKRMDGIYSRSDLLERNTLLNKSAMGSDYVIFISNFSKISLENLYPGIKIKQSKIVLNRMDDSEFFEIVKSIGYDYDSRVKFISSANSWERPEKRFDVIHQLTKKFKNIDFLFIGNSVVNENQENIYNFDYLEDYREFNRLLNTADAYLYLGFNDPAPKTVCQALNCKLPTFLTNSGGNVELGGDISYYIKDIYTIPMFHDSVPKLDFEYVCDEFSDFVKDIDKFKELGKSYNAKENFNDMLNGYFNVFREFG